jgi:glycosyltransferase involved in cell wall biosynthesis
MNAPKLSAPKLSVGLAVYNGEKYLARAIESILAQDFADFELIISDNASQDATESICRKYARADRRVRYVRRAVNRGAKANLNAVFQMARGTYFKWAAHDDICLPGFFRRCIDTLDAAPDSVVLVYPRTEAIDESGNPFERYAECLDARHPRPHRRLAHVLRQLDGLSAQYGIIRSAALIETRLYDTTIAAEDFVLLAELAMLGEFWEVPEALFQRRIHPDMDSKVQGRSSTRRRRSRGSAMMRLGYEFVRSASRLPLDTEDRWLCYVTAPSVWYFREFRNWAGRQRRRYFDGARIDQPGSLRQV